MEVKELKNMIYLTNDECLLEFIQKEFESICFGATTIQKYKNNIDTLKKLDQDTINAGIARMERIVEGNDPTKSISMPIAILLAMVSVYCTFIFSLKGGLYSFIFNILIYALLFLYISFFIGKSLKKRSTAVFFKKLLEFTKEK